MRKTGFSGARRNRAGMRFLLPLALFLTAACAVGAQQITRIAVLDLPRVLNYFSKEYAALKNFEAKKAEIQADLNARSAEIKALAARKSDAAAQGNNEMVQSLDGEIARKTAELKEYAAARQNELDLLAKSLSSGASFLQRLNSAITQTAESEGFSIVLNSKPQDQGANLILWNSQSIDITDRVIQLLSTGR